MTERWEWVEIIEPRTQEHMYANLTTGECVWDPPPGVRIKKTDDNQWWELFDQNTSRYYYYNATSQKTVWHRPLNCDIIPLAKLQTLKQNTEVDDDGEAFKPVARREMSTQTPTTPKRSEYRIITPRTASVRSSASMTTQTSPHPSKKTAAVVNGGKQVHNRQGSARSRDDRSLPTPQSNSVRLPRRRGSIPNSGSFTSPTEDVVSEPRKSLDSPKPRRSRDRDSSRGSMDSAGSHYGSHGRSASYDSSGPRSMDSSYTRESPVLKAPTPDYRTIDNSMQNRYYDSGTYSRDSGSQSQSRSSLDSNPKVYTEMSVGTHQHGYESSHSRSSYDSSPHGLLDPPQQQQQQQQQVGEPIYSSAESDSTTGRPKRSFPRTNPAFNSASRRNKRDEPQYYDRYEIQELLNNSGIQEDELSDYQASRQSDSRQSDSDSSFRQRDRSQGSRDRSDGSRDWSEGRSEGSQGSRTIRDVSDTHSQSSQGSRNLDFHQSAQSLNSQRSNQEPGTPRDVRDSPRVVYAQPQRLDQRVERLDYPSFPMSSIQPPSDESHVYQELEEARRNVSQLRDVPSPQVREAQTVAVPMTPTHAVVQVHHDSGYGQLDSGYGQQDSPNQLHDSSGSEGAHRNFSSSLYTHLNWPGYGDDNQDDSDNSSVFSSPSPQPRHTSPPSLDLHHASLRSSLREKSEAGTPILEKSLSLQAELAHHRPISMVVASHSEANMMSAGTNSLHRSSYRHISVPTTRSSNSLSRNRRPGSDTEIEQYAEKNLNTHKKGLFGKKMSLSLMLSWSKDPIQKPMLRTELKSVKKEALETFKLIQQYMGDRKSKLTPPEVALQLTTKGWSMAEIRDELYIQLCRQTTDNSWDESILRGWELIAICLAFFPPTQKFHTYLEGYICRHLDPACDTQTVPISHFAAYCHKKLARITKMGPKRGVRKPTPDEVEAARRCIFQPSMFGATLEEVMHLQRHRFPELRLPWIQTTLSEEVLRLGGARVEGIFRVPGDIDEVNSLKVRVDQWLTPDLCPDPHIPASLLKLWLRELYEPIIPEDVYQQCIDNYANPEAAIDIVMGLPEINKLVLCYLVRFLQVFAALENAIVTKMDINNLAMVMAPNCLRCESEEPKVIFENTRKEMAFMRTLVQSLDTSFMEGVR